METNIEKIIVSAKGFDDYIDITSKVEDIVSNFAKTKGIVNLYVPSSCASLKIIENEPGLGFDISKLMEILAPVNKIYQHDNIWHDGNAFSHLKTFLLGNSLTLPIVDSRLFLSLYQRIIMLDFDNKVSQKEIIVSVLS